MRKAAEYIILAVAILLMIATALAFIAPGFGWRVDAVLSGSMEPGIHVGSIEVTRPVHVETIKTGDIITFTSPATGKLTSHRVVAIEESTSYHFQTKGDANESADPFLVPAQNVVGRVCFHLSLLGYVVQFLKTPTGLFLLGLFGLIIIIAEVSSIWKTPAQEKIKAK